MAETVSVKGILGIAAIAAGAYAIYRVLVKKDKPTEAIKNTLEKPVEVVKDVIETTGKVGKRLVKGSSDAKERMAKLAKLPRAKRGTGKRAMAKKKKSENKTFKDLVAHFYAMGYSKKEATERAKAQLEVGGDKPFMDQKPINSHKGHKTKEGLAQDQKLNSEEPHEKAYRKGKKK